jgi:NitT/TauT family transport system substrate-binding protein
MKLKSILTALAAVLLSVSAPAAEPLKIAYSDWPGFTILEVAKQKGWFKEAGVDVELTWFDYGPSIDAFAAGKVDAVTAVGTDMLGTGASGAKSKFIALLDFSEGSDMIIGAPGINSIKDLKGKQIGVELTLVEHLLLLKALKENGMKQSDVKLVKMKTDDAPQTLASGSVSAVGAWYPLSGQALKQVAGSKALFTSADAKGLIYDVLAVNPASLAKRKDDWAKVVAVYYKCVDYLKDPATKDEAIKFMAAKVKVDPADYEKNIPGTHLLTLAEAKTAYKKGPGLDSVYGAMTNGDTFNRANGVYKAAQKPEAYIFPGFVDAMK